jgi:hypothetical protein
MYDDHGLIGSSTTTGVVAYDTTFFQKYGGGNAHLTFDRNLATLSLTAGSDSWFVGSVRVSERFDVSGVPVGTPVNATLVYQFNGWTEQGCGASGCGVLCYGTLVHGADSVSVDANQMGPGYGRVDKTGTVTLPLTVIAGSPVEATLVLTYHTFFGGGGDAQATGVYGISGLPPGVRAVACPGADVTPVRQSTWGAVKTTYR